MSAATQVQPLSYDVGACTERGLRSYQEDAVGHDVGANVSVFAVADGLGGHPNGDRPAAPQWTRCSSPPRPVGR
ncbi:PP2C family serine/threonine-protein phosphatase [Myxococcus sp. MxC21-1]|uniref:PP2C family serine/threonine-protein phosphatase n=1 Tax=Myxococcus sp. MxC21-1 TaxID=3041439 RepID=UPI00292DDB41|nr:PP2C family serine/threonine-protein phosphatase [Myxococcus sp. MxC21-1]WNZ59946.1 PP2C family serine/threonine-protein phosphatase [Myxococcus sp. MxC21-1]